MKDIKSIESLISLSSHIQDLLQRYDQGEDYESVQLGTAFQKLVTPLISGNELIPELRAAVPPTELHELTRNVGHLRRACTFSRGKARANYGGSVRIIKSVLESMRDALVPQKKPKGAWTIFYSWQSTLPNSTNRSLIRNSLEKAAAALNKELSLEDSHRVDSDTSDRPGSPKIFETILEKIEACDVFVADVSLVADKQSNSNVMVELGFALKALGSNGIVMVFNTAYGAIRDLPFDLGFNRVIAYSCEKEQDDKGVVRDQLAKQLKTAIDAICRPESDS